MHDFHESPPRTRRAALSIWWIAVIALLGPALLAWGVRGIAFTYSCAPEAQLCHAMPLGNLLRTALDAAWFIGENTLFTLLIGLAAGIVALFARRPLVAGLSVLLLPPATLVLPTYAVYYSTYSACHPNESGIGDCLLWGTNMGMSFHHAATAHWLVDSMMPYNFALALMVGAVGFMFCRER